ncbi:hypothetical protein L579_1213 [Pantoea sp. AS-PWVM4]|nr:hypothetical protein L579_1213 [Pantoea sp. AS-PWVM4]
MKDRENDFINGGTAALSPNTAPDVNAVEAEPVKKAKAKPVSISFTDENLSEIDNRIRNEILAGGTRVNRSDIVRAAILGLERFSDEEISVLISRAKLQ